MLVKAVIELYKEKGYGRVDGYDFDDGIVKSIENEIKDITGNYNTEHRYEVEAYICYLINIQNMKNLLADET